jgi:hypothetical protein
MIWISAAVDAAWPPALLRATPPGRAGSAPPLSSGGARGRPRCWVAADAAERSPEVFSKGATCLCWSSVPFQPLVEREDSAAIASAISNSQSGGPENSGARIPPPAPPSGPGQAPMISIMGDGRLVVNATLGDCESVEALIEMLNTVKGIPRQKSSRSRMKRRRVGETRRRGRL